MRPALAVIVLALLAFFGLYGVAPMFGLNAMFPALFGESGWVGRAVLLVLMAAGGILYVLGRRGKRDD